MPSYPRDRFDDLPADLARVGAHRAPPKRGRGFVAFAWAALATGLLVGAGVVGLRFIDVGVADIGPSASASPTPTITPTIDPKIDVVFLNATTTSGLAAKAASAAKAGGWTVESTANASSTDVKTTTVYYTLAGQAGAAAGLAKTLGITSTAKSAQFAVPGQSRLTVVLGKDYAAAH